VSVEKSHRAIGRISKSLEAAQKDLTAIGTSVGTGASDLRKDVAKLLRDTRREVTKMSKTVRRDLDRLQKDVSTASKPKARRAQPRKAKAKSATASRARRKRA
jgi:ABC-type transporter Mla subunit MlaD